MSLKSETARASAGTMVDIFRDWQTLLLAGLGLTMSGIEFLGGLLLAIAGGSIAAHLKPESEQRERQAFWLTVVMAFFVAYFAGAASSILAPDWPPQFAMGLAGFASRYVVSFCLRFLDRASGHGAKAADRVLDRVLPPNEGGQE